MNQKHVIMGEGYTMLDAFRIFSFMYGVPMFDLRVGALEDPRMKRPCGFVLTDIDKTEWGEGTQFTESDSSNAVRV